MNPTASRSVIDKMAQAMLHDDAARAQPAAVLRALGAGRDRGAVGFLVADRRRSGPCWPDCRPPARTARWCRSSIRPRRAFPYSGRIEFVEPEGGGVITAGRAERWADDYVARVALHRDEIRAETNKLDWLFSTHTTSRSAAELLLFLHSRHDGEQGQRARRHRQSGATRMIAGLPLAFAEPFLLLGLLSLPVLWWLLRVMPPRPRRIEFPPTRLLFDIAPKEETPVAHAVVADRCCGLPAAALVILAAAGPIWNPQTGARRLQRAAGDPARRRLERGGELGHPDQGRGRTDRERRQRPARRRAGAAVGARARHHADAGAAPRGWRCASWRPNPIRSSGSKPCRRIERFLKATGDARSPG